MTLLFSVESYATIAEAYIRGLERRQEEGKSLDVHSVASFFVSRVDTEVDKRLEELGNGRICTGTAAVANARAAYMRFKELFHGERFAALREAGAPVQRPLWASTGVKNPHYPETMYVEELVAPDTVNTMPMPTLLACAEQRRGHGRHRRTQDPTSRPEAARGRRNRHGRRDDKLLRDGIEQFVEPFDKLIGGIERAARRRHRAPEDDRVGDPGRARAGDRRARSRRPRQRGRRPAHLGATTSRSGAAPACPRSATGSAG